MLFIQYHLAVVILALSCLAGKFVQVHIQRVRELSYSSTVSLICPVKKMLDEPLYPSQAHPIPFWSADINIDNRRN